MSASADICFKVFMCDFKQLVSKWVGFFIPSYMDMDRILQYKKNSLGNSELNFDFFCFCLFYLWNHANIVMKHTISTRLILHWIVKKDVTGNNSSDPAKRCIRVFKSFRANQRKELFEKNIKDLKMSV